MYCLVKYLFRQIEFAQLPPPVSVIFAVLEPSYYLWGRIYPKILYPPPLAMVPWAPFDVDKNHLYLPLASNSAILMNPVPLLRINTKYYFTIATGWNHWLWVEFRVCCYIWRKMVLPRSERLLWYLSFVALLFCMGIVIK